MRTERIRIAGQVQGVGFRPHVWRVARACGVAGSVGNDAEGVIVLARAERPALDAFVAGLVAEAPALARIDAVRRETVADDPSLGDFAIAASGARGARTAITPDVATCADCAAEIADPRARRHRYPFANCTNCGPRFSIVEALPYDRATTTMRAFPLCPACRAEYEDPADRRFHAQPIACPACGPQARLEPDSSPGSDPVAEAASRLRRGETLAVKGVGGWHLACDARNEAAVARLRARKRRPGKPFAVMARDLDEVRRYALVSAAEAAALADPAAPIVLLEAAGEPLAPSVAPGQGTLGFMLAYAPLHILLCAALDGPLVMTSGNLSGDPQAIGDDEARETLAGFVDGFLGHDRPIARRLDDSVVRVASGARRVVRRARGLAPAAVRLAPAVTGERPVTAYGGQMKAALCLLRPGEAVLSHHLGDLESAEAVGAFHQADADYHAIYEHRPAAIACDLHPDFHATRHAEARAEALGIPLVRVQHHHAHVVSCMAENGWDAARGPVVGIVLDGLGLGEDGTIWGGEVLLATATGYRRLAWLRPVPLIGGSAAQVEPWRNLLAHIDAAAIDAEGVPALAGKPLETLRRMAARGLNAPPTSSAGRLFDAVAAMLGLAPERQTYEGEAAMLLEAAARRAPGGAAAPYPFARAGDAIDPGPMWRALAADRTAGVPPETCAARFHAGLARAFADAARRALAETGARAVALSGGCFQNGTLLAGTLEALDGVETLTHAEVPANDGGLALGQAVVAAARLNGGA